jgi:hypothetical protein
MKNVSWDLQGLAINELIEHCLSVNDFTPVYILLGFTMPHYKQSYKKERLENQRKEIARALIDGRYWIGECISFTGLENF